MKRLFVLALLTLTTTAVAANAATINIDLSGATTGSLITGVGASFAQAFAGQTVVGFAVTGSPTDPLTLQAVGTIDVAFFNPGVSAASNSLLSQPGNAAPLSILLGSTANSFSWTMGSSVAGSTILAQFFAANGALVHSQSVVMGSGYNVYSLAALPTFSGITFSDDNDPAGVRFQNMSYNSVDAAPVPEPSTLVLMGLGLAAAGAARRKLVK